MHMKTKKLSITPQTVCNILILVFFFWFVMACLIMPNINTIWSVFVQEGEFTLEPLQKLLGSERAMKSLKNSFILAPSLALTVGFVGISLVLITEYFDIKGARILSLGFMTTLIYAGIVLVTGYKFVYGATGIVTMADMASRKLFFKLFMARADDMTLVTASVEK